MQLIISTLQMPLKDCISFFLNVSAFSQNYSEFSFNMLTDSRRLMSSVNLISVLAIPSARLLIKLLNITRAITNSLGILLSPFFKFRSKPLITVLFVQLYSQLFAHLIGILWGKYCRHYQQNCKNEAIWHLPLLTCNSYFFILWKKIARAWIVLDKGKLMAV